MNRPIPSFRVKVDVTNPGQFFACCGLVELAHRLWLGAEACFAHATSFVVYCEKESEALETLLLKLRTCTLSGLSVEQRRERDALEAESRRLKKLYQRLPEEKEARRTELGEMARKGAIRIGAPFNLVLNWWQTDDEDRATPKTWAGRQELHKVARAAQDAMSELQNPQELLEYSSVLRMPAEYRKGKSDEKKSVEPFYFDARRFAHALDAGFSLDVQDAETVAHPAVELLSLIGLQRFRPVPASEKWNFQYWTWQTPLAPCVAAGVTSGVVPTAGRQGYRFQLLFRDDQRRYKAFNFANAEGKD